VPSASEGPSLFDDLPPSPATEAGGGPSNGRRSSGKPADGGGSDHSTPGADIADTGPSRRAGAGQRVVRVLPDEPAIAKTFDYLVPEGLGDQVRVGTRVRIALGPRRVGGWIVATDVEPPPDRELRPLAKLSGYGPPAELIDLAHWAAWRWAGRPATFLRTASPERIVTALPRPPAPRRAASPPGGPPAWRPGAEHRVTRQAGGSAGHGLEDRPAGPAPAGSASGSGPQPHSPAGKDAERGSGAPDDGGPADVQGIGVGPRERGESGPPDAFAGGVTVLRLAPGDDPHPIVRAAAGLGHALVVCPGAAQAESVGRRLRRDGVVVASHPRDWGLGAAGATVVGTRAAAWAPVGELAAVVVLDEHDEGHAQEQAPTWHARDVVVERARRAGVPCVLVSPCPTLEALGLGRLLVPSRRDERDGWPVVDVVDRRDDDPRTGLFSSTLVDLLRSDRRVLSVLNRTGRARLLACRACGELARCERCEAAVTQPGDGELVCPRCGAARPVVCTSCGASRLKLLRQGVTRVREELEALVGEPVGEVTGAPPSLKEKGPIGAEDLQRRVVVGTEAALHQSHGADVVAFLDLDQELLAPRYRAAEQALALLARAARILGGKGRGGRLVLQTRLPHHEVVQAALHGDPERVAAAEHERRELLRFPPTTALAEVSGAAAPQYVGALTAVATHVSGLAILGPADGRWLVKADDHRTLCDALAAAPRPPGRLRIAVDPLRV
jgi:primosomal protein N' (replication factor Y) (superfamily II helicase)